MTIKLPLHSRITGTGSFLPPNRVSNAALAGQQIPKDFYSRVTTVVTLGGPLRIETARRQAEIRLAESEANFRQLFTHDSTFAISLRTA